MAETYYSLTDIVKLCDDLVEAMPTSFYNGIWKVRNTLYRIPSADVVARDCFDKILAENDDMRAIIDTYGGLENIQSAFVKLHEIETADVAPVVRCRDCKYLDKADYGGRRCDLIYHLSVKDDWFCASGEKKDGDGDV